MTIHYLHIRAVDEEGNILSKGGMTIAYALVEYGPNDARDIIYTYSICSKKDLFCYRTGREVADKRFKDCSDAETLDVIEEVHPRSNNLINYLSDTFFDDPIDIYKHKSGRWVSTFNVRDDKSDFTIEVDPEFVREAVQEYYNGA